jgi:hypothetical protein
MTRLLVPAQGRTVPLETGAPWPTEAGAPIPYDPGDSRYVRRRLADGDLVVARPGAPKPRAEPADPKKQER